MSYRSDTLERLDWRKSSFSSDQGGACVEVAMTPDWRKSSFSSPQGGDCVEVAVVPERVHLRDSKNPAGATLTFSAATWSAFLQDIRAGELDLT